MRISDETVLEQLLKIEADPEDHVTIAGILKLWVHLAPNIRTMQRTRIASRLEGVTEQSEYVYIECMVRFVFLTQLPAYMYIKNVFSTCPHEWRVRTWGANCFDSLGERKDLAPIWSREYIYIYDGEY